MKIVVLVLIVVYYRYVAPEVVRAVTPRFSRLAIQSTHSYASVESVVALSFACLFQAVFFVLLLYASDLSRSDLGLVSFSPVLLIYGAVLGVGEMAFASFLCFTCVQGFELRRDTRLGGLASWLAISRSGWMRQYLRTIETIPWPAALLLVCAYVSVEELVFRSLVIPTFLPERVLALAASVVLFSFVQLFNMPSWRHGLFPFIGAVTMGIVHGLLFIEVPVIFPLILAHVTFFGSALMLGQNAPSGSEVDW